MKKKVTLTSVSGSLGTSVKIILTLLFLNFFVSNISAQVKIDGLANSVPNEWCQAGLTHTQDLFGNGVAEDQFTEGSKDFMFAVDWRWSISQTKGKNDLANVSAGIVTNVTTATGTALTGTFLVFAGDRLVNNGDAQIGFWFFQNGTAPVVQPDGTQNFAPPKKPGPGPVVGDILVLADFTGGGRDATVTVLEWVGTGGNYAESDAFNLLGVQAGIAENNAGPTPVPSCFDYPTDMYAQNAFFEGYVDLSTIGATSVCFARVMLEGRSSQEITASLDDFVGGPLGSFPTCDITGNNTICQGTSTCFTASGGSGTFTYAWSGPGGYTATGAVACNISVAGAYNVTVTNATGCNTTCSRTLTLNPPPTCNILPGNQTICAGSSASFTATGGVSYIWSTGATTAVISNVTAAGTYSVTITSGAGCTNACSRTLTRVDNPVCNILPDNQTICAGSSGSFTASGGTTYLWSTGATTAVISNLTAAGTYSVTVTAGAGCTSTCSRTLSFVPNASANAGADPAAQCRAASVVNGSLVFGVNTFSVTGTVSGGTPTWSVFADGGYSVTIVSPNSLTTNVQVGGNVNGGTVTLRLTATSNSTPPCGNATDNVNLVINPLPLVKVVEGSEFCPNVTTTGSVTLHNSQVGVSYQLMDDGPNPVQAPKVGTGGDLVWTGLADGSYTVVGTFLATSCNTTSGPASVDEQAVPEVVITPVAQLCNNQTACVTLSATPAGGTFSGTGVSGSQFCPNGLAPGQYTVTYTFTNTAGCTDVGSIDIDVVSCEAALCTYTQGAFGSEGGKSCDGTNDDLSTIALINQSIANWGGSITIGCGTDAVIVSSAQCVIDKLPGGGKSVELDLAAPISLCNLPDGMLKNGTINNTLLAQTLALALNIGITSPSSLSNFPLQAGTLYTAAVDGGCGSEVPLVRECIYDGTGQLIDVINEYEQRSFSQALIDGIVAAGYPATVGGLFSFASDALCNKDGEVGEEQNVSLSEIAGAAGSINEVFDECRIAQGWDLGPCPQSNTIAPPRIMVGASAEAAGIAKLKVSAFPNPYRDNVRFVIESPVSGEAILDVYNITGQKLQTLYKGHMQANETRVVDYRPKVANGMMIYKLRIGNQQVTGKLIGVKQ